MSIYRGGVLLFTNELTPLMIAARTPDSHSRSPPKDEEAPLDHERHAGAPSSLHDRLESVGEFIGWTPPTAMALVTLALIFTFTSFACFRYELPTARAFPTARTAPAAATAPALDAEGGDSISGLWGAYSPYRPVEAYQPPPRDCRINQVNIIQRHGARFPTSGADERIRGALGRLRSAHAYLDARFAFLREYRYPLGINDLVSFGAFQSGEAGAETYERYPKLVWKGKGIPFVRASGSGRVIDSATNWTAGFADANSNVYEPKLTVILAEHLNDTLDDHMCPGAGTPELQVDVWTEIFATPIAERLNALAPGATVTPDDVPPLMSICAFESIALEMPSPFCAFFTKEEFEQYEYLSDLEKYYNRGYGQPLGPVQGVGYINELLARLTGKPVVDNTQTNRTLNASPETFPLDRTIYADFSHDNLMIAVFAAMGLLKRPSGTHLDPMKMEDSEGRSWVTSRITPFSGRMVVERMQCKGRVALDVSENYDSVLQRVMKGKAKRRGGTFVRVLLNDAVQPLELCGADQDGLCGLNQFVESQAYARNDGYGDFEKCFRRKVD